MERRIIDFITNNQVLTIATVVDSNPYCANCFYVFDESSNTLIFLSDKKTRHVQEATANHRIAGTIWDGETTVSDLRGIQFTGKFIVPDKQLTNDFYAIYYSKFPFAEKIPSPVWGIQLDWLKMTDNTLGFGKKLIWKS